MTRAKPPVTREILSVWYSCTGANIQWETGSSEACAADREQVATIPAFEVGSYVHG